jgi:hypothetical protein
MPSTQSAVAVVDDTLRDALLRERLLISTGVPGVYGLGEAFDDTLARIDRFIGQIGAADHPEVVRFPPILNRRHFAQSGYLASFPHLAGTVHSFEGTDRMHGELLRAVAQGQDWSAAFPATDVEYARGVLSVHPVAGGCRRPAACSTCVIGASGMSLRTRRTDADVRMREFVRAGDPQTVMAWREAWRSRARRSPMCCSSTRADAAADPFFGRGARTLAESQRDQRLKIEILGTGVVRRLQHRDHVAQLPSGPLRRALSHHNRGTAQSPTRPGVSASND